MRTILRASMAALLLTLFMPISQAAAQVDLGVLDPHVDITDVGLFTAPDGEIWVDVTPAEPWEDGAPPDPFSLFFVVDISNDTDASSSGWQVHDGEQTAFGTADVSGTPSEFVPTVYLVNSGEQLRLSTVLMPPVDGAGPLFFSVGGASMATPDAPRVEFPGFSGQVPDQLETMDPRLDATHEFDGTLFAEVTDPVTSADQLDPDAESGSDVIDGDTTDTLVPADGEAGLETDDDVDSSEPDTSDSAAEATDGSSSDSPTGDGTDSGGGGSIIVIGALIALVAAIFAWLFLKRKAAQDDQPPTRVDLEAREVLGDASSLEDNDPII